VVSVKEVWSKVHALQSPRCKDEFLVDRNAVSSPVTLGYRLCASDSNVALQPTLLATPALPSSTVNLSRKKQTNACTPDLTRATATGRGINRQAAYGLYVQPVRPTQPRKAWAALNTHYTAIESILTSQLLRHAVVMNR
jgi:hypothetical protein